MFFLPLYNKNSYLRAQNNTHSYQYTSIKYAYSDSTIRRRQPA